MSNKQHNNKKTRTMSSEKSTSTSATKREKAAPAKKIPVTVITGFLGSGKTTLLNYILSADHGKRIAVIENEFGEVGVDDALVKQRIQGDEEVFEMNNGCICCTVRGDLIRILNDLAKNKRNHFDFVIIETTGLADPAPVAQTFFVDPDIEAMYELDGIVTVVDCKHVLLHLDEEKPEGVENESVEQLAFADVILLNKTDLVPAEEVKSLRERIKSINHVAKMIETKQSVVEPLSQILDIKSFDIKRVTSMDPNFLLDQDHEHDKSVSSVGFAFEGDLVQVHFHAWISELMQTLGPSLFRYKGVLSMAGLDTKTVFQGVHMLFACTEEEKWAPGEVRQNRLVFIGRNLDRAILKEGFEACKAQPLRFAVGADVLFKSGKDKYQPGTVIRHWDEGNAYRIKSKVGKKDDVWAPADDDFFVKEDPMDWIESGVGSKKQGGKNNHKSGKAQPKKAASTAAKSTKASPKGAAEVKADDDEE